MKRIHINLLVLAVILAIVVSGINIFAYTRCPVCGKITPVNLVYCDEHRCIVQGCASMRWDYGQGEYCQDHENEFNPHYCQYPGCGVQVETEYNYCSNHICAHNNCPNMRIGTTIYCYDHRNLNPAKNNSTYSDSHCAAEHCTRTRVSGKKYCYLHACYVNGCNDEATKSYNGKRYCASHYQWVSAKTKTKDVWPDCDDYDDQDEYLDDWEGYMPDDADAEDYWDDW